MLLTDMAANGHVIDDINKMAEEMIAMSHGQTKYVQKRQAEMNSKLVTANSKHPMFYAIIICIDILVPMF